MRASGPCCHLSVATSSNGLQQEKFWEHLGRYDFLHWISCASYKKSKGFDQACQSAGGQRQGVIKTRERALKTFGHVGTADHGAREPLPCLCEESFDARVFGPCPSERSAASAIRCAVTLVSSVSPTGMLPSEAEPWYVACRRRGVDDGRGVECQECWRDIRDGTRSYSAGWWCGATFVFSRTRLTHNC